MTQDLRYPVGKFAHAGEVDGEQRESWIHEVEQLPAKLAEALGGLTEEQLDTPYREGGWTLRQVAHHLADSHMNSLIRFKLALTEIEPTIKPYEENDWAQLADSREAPVDLALTLVEALHARWTILLRSMSDADFAKTFYHPGNQKTARLDQTLGLYAWHGRHHVAHIAALRERKGW